MKENIKKAYAQIIKELKENKGFHGIIYVYDDHTTQCHIYIPGAEEMPVTSFGREGKCSNELSNTIRIE